MTDQDAGTPTGRSNTQDILDFMRHFQSPTPSYLRGLMEILGEPEKIMDSAGNLVVATDFSATEDRVVALMVRSGGNGLSYTPILLHDEIRGKQANICIIDDVDVFEQPYKIHPEPYDRLPEDKPTKQNGRDASYLALDPTKNIRKRTKKKR